MDPRLGNTLSPWAPELVWTHIDEHARVAVVGTFDYQHIVHARVCSRQADREFVGLATRVNQKAHTEGAWEGRSESGEIVGEFVVDVSAVSVLQSHLALSCSHDMGVAMAHVAHVVD